jgi:plastocyanin
MRVARPLALALFATLAVAACSSGEAPGWTYAPAPSPTPIPSAEPSAAASAEPTAAASAEPSQAPGDGVVLELSAQNVQYDTDSLEAPADTPFQIRFANNDAGVPHNVEIRDSMSMSLWKGEIFNGIETRVYDVPALPAGTYTFVCTVHPNMVGTLTVK